MKDTPELQLLFVGRKEQKKALILEQRLQISNDKDWPTLTYSPPCAKFTQNQSDSPRCNSSIQTGLQTTVIQMWQSLTTNNWSIGFVGM